MEIDDVRAVLDALAGVPHWVAGGWGVDLLVGAQTRPHRDLDLAVDAACLDDAVAALGRLGYAARTDWLPVRLELAAPGERFVDLHPVVFDAAGDGRQAGPDGSHFAYPHDDLGVGWLDGRVVPCLSASRQRVFHAGYEPRPHDLLDLARLDEVDARTETGLLIEVPAAEPVVGGLRARLDAAAALAVPAHVTVLFPFLASRDLSAVVLDRLARVVGRHRGFDLTFATTGWFGREVLWLAPADPGPLIALSNALQAEFPDWPLYGGAYDVVVPHLTVAHQHSYETLRSAEADLLPSLPVTQHVAAVGVFVGSPVHGFRRVQQLWLGRG